MPCIMIVEDDVGLSQGIALCLKREAYRFVHCATLAEARMQFAAHTIDLILLDVGLPDGNGLALCAELRAQSTIPILFLTANDAEHDEVAGFLAGGDDYITKPFRLTVLRARVDAALRRIEMGQTSIFNVGGFQFDFEHLTFSKQGKPLVLSISEQKLLRLLISRRGETVQREQLQQALWESGAYVDENTLTVAIRRLRTKLEDDPKHPMYLQTVYGVGYRWMEGAHG